MHVRDLNLNDLVRLEKDSKFPLPNMGSNLFFVKKSIVEDGELIASFWLKLTSEVTLILNSMSSRLTKARAIRTLFDNLTDTLPTMNINDVHILVKDNDDFAKLLVKHFDFKDDLGIPLYLTVDDAVRRKNELRRW